jgi:hypothetical protein
MKAEEIETELRALQQRKEELTQRLLNTSFGIYEENSVEALSRQVNIDLRVSQMTKKAKNQIMFVGSIDEMKKIITETQETEANQIKMRTVVGEGEYQDEIADSADGQALRLFLGGAWRANCSVDLRFVAKRSFNLAIVDGKEAIWGESMEQPERKVLWTNDPVQVGILKRAFENLWQEATPCECQTEIKTITLV